ncbi:hypothetical protein [Paludibacterium sp. B53371]|uniref:hypothetical protein n=1 Tax=Paludibacterium sp. B53371 TaxID=2806263 RepID=UPI001C04B86D|nr:hypothetical protein [Paludibacterium sp. B53371]
MLSEQQGVSLSSAQQQVIANSKFFEAGASMAILDHAGQVGQVYNSYAAKLSKVLTIGLDASGSAGQQQVFFQGKTQSLSAVLTQVFSALSAKTDQIGRQMSQMQPFQSWLLHSLRQPLVPDMPDNYLPLMTKIRALSAFGTTLWQLMNPVDIPSASQEYAVHMAENRKACQMLLSESGMACTDFSDRFRQFAAMTRTPLFDLQISRARSERMPLIQDGESLYPVKGVYEDAARYGLGFGLVVQKVDPAYPAQQAALTAALGENNRHINAIPRQGAPIEDLTRPFTMSEEEWLQIPLPYQQLGMEGLLDRHRLFHGTGVNRWQLFGTSALESSQKGLPAAGAQSGGTCDILLALHSLSDKSLYGQAHVVMPATLGIAAFMNFGAYHTFAETFPIGEAMAEKHPFVPSQHSPSARRSELYDRVQQAAAASLTKPGIEQLGAFRDAHVEIQSRLLARHPDLNLHADGDDLVFFAHPEQIVAWQSDFASSKKGGG